MKVSLNTVKQLVDFELPDTKQLVAKINEQIGGVEKIDDLGAKYQGIHIVRIVECIKHPDADKLSVCAIDDGGVVSEVERDERGYVQVVCGAPNARADIFAVWLPPRTTVPASFDDAEPFVLDARKLRGVMSNGMLAAADELAIGGDHNGIIELTNNDLSPRGSVRELVPGLDFAQVFGLDDTTIDIENKMFTHRPDCFGQIGVAREIAGVLHQQFASPEWYLDAPELHGASGLELTVANEAGENVPRFMAVAVKDVTIKQSPFWLQCELIRMGSKPINNVVDITNYFMLMTAQPLHAYDYDKLRGHAITARMASDGEKTTLLNGKSYELTTSDIVIADGEGVIGLGGIMGGGESEVTNETKNIVLECATFDMYTIRKTSMRHGLFTDAVTRFNKGQSPLQNDRIIAQAVSYVAELAGGAQASDIIDWRDGTVEPKNKISLVSSFINDRLGTTIGADRMAWLLANVEVSTSVEGESIIIEPPFWRTDLEISEDIVEEIGRLEGFDTLPRALPTRSMAPAPRNPKNVLRSHVREVLSRLGANEVVTYSFVHEQIMKRAGQDPSRAFTLGNALSPDLQYYRLSILPSLLDKVYANSKSGYDEFALFEMGKTHDKHDHATDGEDGLPYEREVLELVYASKHPRDGAAYFVARRMVGELAKELGFVVTFTAISEERSDAESAPYEQSRSALVQTMSGEILGIVGELKQSTAKNFKLPEYVAAFSLDLGRLRTAYEGRQNTYRPLSKYPAIANDISLQTAATVPYEELSTSVRSSIERMIGTADYSLSPLSIYQAADDVSVKTTTFHLECVSQDKTLTDDDLKPVIEAIAADARENVGAQIA